jgi:type IV secretion system protein VirB9
MKKLLGAILLCIIPSVVVAAASKSPADMYFSGENPELTKQEKAAIAIAEKWMTESETGIDPFPGPNGTIKFVYGAQRPNIVCAVLQVCDVALQPGEQVNSINLGDTVRWTIEPAITGVGSEEVQHIIIKPLDVGLETSLIVTTNRRAYHFGLRSHRTLYMPKVSFTYPEEALAKWENIKTREEKDRQEKTMPDSGEYLGDLDFEYEVSGRAGWKPLRVYNDGVKTIIQMPPAMAQTEAPTLLVVRKEGGLFTQDDTVMVNYRVQGDRYIVDTIFDKAILIAGVGSSQDRITISKGPADNSLNQDRDDDLMGGN